MATSPARSPRSRPCFPARIPAGRAHQSLRGQHRAVLQPHLHRAGRRYLAARPRAARSMSAWRPAPSSFGIDKQPDQLGIVAQTTGNVSTFTYGDLQVNQSRAVRRRRRRYHCLEHRRQHRCRRAARKPPSRRRRSTSSYDSNGQPTVTLRAAIAGSGIQALAATPGVKPGQCRTCSRRAASSMRRCGYRRGQPDGCGDRGARRQQHHGLGHLGRRSGCAPPALGRLLCRRLLDRRRHRRTSRRISMPAPVRVEQHAGGRCGHQLARRLRHRSRRRELQARRHGVPEARKRDAATEIEIPSAVSCSAGRAERGACQL